MHHTRHAAAAGGVCGVQCSAVRAVAAKGLAVAAAVCCSSCSHALSSSSGGSGRVTPGLELLARRAWCLAAFVVTAGWVSRVSRALGSCYLVHGACACSSAGAALAALSYFVSAGLGRVYRSVLFSCVLSCCRFHAHTNCPILQLVLGGRACRTSGQQLRLSLFGS